MAKTAIDPIFTAYAKTAPLLDLQFYIRYATNHATEYDDSTRMALSAMCHLEADMIAGRVKGSPASQKRTVWTLIDAFKAARSRPVFDEAGFWAFHSAKATAARAAKALKASRKVAA